MSRAPVKNNFFMKNSNHSAIIAFFCRNQWQFMGETQDQG